MAKTTRDHLVDTLEDLGEKNFKKFKTKLCDRKEEPRIRKGAIEGADNLDLTEKLISTYTEQGAVKITIEILESIGCAQEASDFKQNTGFNEQSAGGAAAAAAAAGGPLHMVGGQHFVDRHRTALIERVSQVESILDRLLERGVITQMSYSDIVAETGSVRKMRNLLMGPMNASGNLGKDVLYDILQELEPYLMNDLSKQ
ncbi:hypothetical protein MATL_G00124430 [Megalops atlanticus]|uniref:Apoptosis-associated speck-like protein containing a CARD n=1 Tax=Megalops atlanticus TaxID=7932 RepID=A0A9D3T6G9_MEGAT|nr:hypothetical protein MATL_G00124430 [Megalops atlanticus]